MTEVAARNLEDVQSHSSGAVKPEFMSTEDQKHINVQDGEREPLLQAMPSSTFNHNDPKFMCCCGCMHVRTGPTEIVTLREIHIHPQFGTNTAKVKEPEYDMFGDSSDKSKHSDRAFIAEVQSMRWRESVTEGVPLTRKSELVSIRIHRAEELKEKERVKTSKPVDALSKESASSNSSPSLSTVSIQASHFSAFSPRALPSAESLIPITNLFHGSQEPFGPAMLREPASLVVEPPMQKKNAKRAEPLFDYLENEIVLDDASELKEVLIYDNAIVTKDIKKELLEIDARLAPHAREGTQIKTDATANKITVPALANYEVAAQSFSVEDSKVAALVRGCGDRLPSSNREIGLNYLQFDLITRHLFYTVHPQCRVVHTKIGEIYGFTAEYIPYLKFYPSERFQHDEYDFMFIPILIPNKDVKGKETNVGHFTLALFDVRRKRSYYFDSFHRLRCQNPMYVELELHLAGQIRKAFDHVRKNDCEDMIPKQPDGQDTCGYRILFIMDHVMQHNSVDGLVGLEFDIEEQRQKFKSMLP